MKDRIRTKEERFVETLTLFFYLKTDALPLSRIPSESRLKPGVVYGGGANIFALFYTA